MNWLKQTNFKTLTIIEDLNAFNKNDLIIQGVILTCLQHLMILVIFLISLMHPQIP